MTKSCLPIVTLLCLVWMCARPSLANDSSVMAAMREAMLKTSMKCQHNFNSCGDEQSLLDLNQGNFCKATRAVEQCALTEKDYFDEDGSFLITGICTQAEFDLIEAAACGGTPTTSPPKTDNGPQDNKPQPTPKPTVTVETRQLWDRLGQSCRDHTLRCLNLDPANVTTVVVDQSLVCPSLEAARLCILGNSTSGSPGNSSSPCTQLEYNDLRGLACGGAQMAVSFLTVFLGIWLTFWNNRLLVC